MGLQLTLSVIAVFLLSALSFCEAKNATVKVVGLIHCTYCIKNQPTSTNTSLDLDVFIICKAKNELKAQGNGAISKEGKFSVTLSSSTMQDPSSIDGCYAKLQSKSGAPCTIRTNQTASVKIVMSNPSKTVMNRPTTIKFSPITCQSAIFWPFPNLTFFASPPPPLEYPLPPPPADLDLAPIASPVQPPLPPPENSPEPSYDPPEPEFGAPSPTPEISSGSQPPVAPPAYRNPIIESPSPPPEPIDIDPSPPVQPPQPSAGVLTPASRRRPSPIPRAPPIPRLPLTPGAPRKYFNAPKSKTKPPRFT